MRAEFAIKEEDMLLTIGIILAIAWLLGFLVFHVSSGLIHVLLFVAIVSFIVHLVSGRRGIA